MQDDGTTFDAIRRIEAICQQLDLGDFDAEKGEHLALWCEIGDLERAPAK